MRDEQSLSSSGLRKGPTLILRYAPVTQITVIMPNSSRLKVMMDSDDTIADVKAHIRFHK